MSATSPRRAARCWKWSDPAALRLEADVPEALINRIQIGQKLSVRTFTQEVSLEGVVSEIAPAADAASRTFNVKLDLPSKTDMRIGQFARVTVPVGETQALRAPASALVRRGQMELVFVLVANHAQLRLVRTGKQIGDEIELVSGVSADEQVVVEGAGQLRDGQAIEARP